MAGVFILKMSRVNNIILSVACGSHLSVHALMLIVPSVLLALKAEFSVGLDVLGMIVAAGSFMFGFGAIFAGLLEKRVGGRNLIIVYQLGSILAILVIISAKSLLILTTGIMILGAFSSLYHPAGLTMLSRRLPNLSKALGYHGVAGSIGLASGPLLAASFTMLYSWRAAFAVLAIANLLLALMTIFLIPGNRSGSEPVVDAQKTTETNRPALILYYFIIILVGFSFAGFTTFMPTHFAINTTAVSKVFSDTVRGGLFTTIVLLGGIVGQLYGGWAGTRYQRTKLLFFILLLNVPLLMAIGYLQGIILVIISIVFGAVHFTIQPVGNALIANFTHSQSRGIGYGISFFLSFGVGSIGAALGGIIAEHYGVQYVFPAMALIIIPALFVAIRLHKIYYQSKKSISA